jgi:hypothetical protein
MRVVLFVIGLCILMPFVAFFIGKYAAFGYFCAKRMWERPNSDNENDE